MWGILPIGIGWLNMLVAFTKSILELSMSARGLGLQSDKPVQQQKGTTFEHQVSSFTKFCGHFNDPKKPVNPPKLPPPKWTDSLSNSRGASSSWTLETLQDRKPGGIFALPPILMHPKFLVYLVVGGFRFQPIWKICASQIGSFSSKMKIKDVWNHHPVVIWCWFLNAAFCVAKIILHHPKNNGCGNILGILFFHFGNYFFSMVSIGGGDVSGGGELSLQRRWA